MPPGPFLRRRRLGHVRAPLRARHREARRHDRNGRQLRHLGSPDAQPDESLGAVHARMKLQHEVEQFLYRQSELLDTKQWQAWIDLFTDDGVYWMPADPAHKHWDGVPSKIGRG